MNLDKVKVPMSVRTQLAMVIKNYGINTPLRMAHFLAQCSHESGGFTLTVENLNYSASRLMEVFRKYFPTLAMSQQYERQPQKIANYVYGNRMGNGPVESGDGFRYRGRGFIQVTGKDNYSAFDVTVPESIISSPDLVATKYPLASAAWFWNKNSLNLIADEGSTDAVITKITRKVNGGTNGIQDRINKFNEYHKSIS